MSLNGSKSQNVSKLRSKYPNNKCCRNSIKGSLLELDSTLYIKSIEFMSTVVYTNFNQQSK